MTASMTPHQFAAAARTLAEVTRSLDLEAPGFRSPPRLVGVDRSLRMSVDAHRVVAVRLAGRPYVAVLADMVEGIVVANRLVSPAADRVRSALWESLAEAGHHGDVWREVA